MFEENGMFEDELIERVDLNDYVKRLEPEIQQLFYQAYGEKIEAMPQTFAWSIEYLLECFLSRGTVREQKLILMRLGIVSGTPMTLQEVADEFGITRERVRQIERRILRPHCPIRRKKLKDFLE